MRIAVGDHVSQILNRLVAGKLGTGRFGDRVAAAEAGELEQVHHEPPHPRCSVDCETDPLSRGVVELSDVVVRQSLAAGSGFAQRLLEVVGHDLDELLAFGVPADPFRRPFFPRGVRILKLQFHAFALGEIDNRTEHKHAFFGFHRVEPDLNRKLAAVAASAVKVAAGGSRPAR